MNALPMLARYNRWANALVYRAAAELPDTDYRADCGAAFRSVHGTLNHLVAADLIWMKRFTGEGDAPGTLDTIVADDLSDLETARRALDARITGWVEGLSADDLAATFSYVRATMPEPVTQPLAPALVHFFNHHTHHRGQVHAMLTRLAGRAPALDLLLYQRESGEGMS